MIKSIHDNIFNSTKDVFIYKRKIKIVNTLKMNNKIIEIHTFTFDTNSKHRFEFIFFSFFSSIILICYLSQKNKK